MFSHVQKIRASSHIMVTWEDKHHLSECPLLPSSLELYVLSMMSYGMEYPFGQFGSVVPVGFPNTKHSSIPAIRKKINSAPAETWTNSYYVWRTDQVSDGSLQYLKFTV